MFHNMCQDYLLPQSRSKDKVIERDMMLMYHIAKGLKVNLPYVILHHMIFATP